jgi:cytochrome d ubiquinol oxidase subunit II
MVSSTSAANNLTAQNTASPAYPLKIMSVVAIILLPVVLIYQAWTYYVFRRRVSTQEFQPQAPSTAPAPPSPPAGQTASQER